MPIEDQRAFYRVLTKVLVYTGLAFVVYIFAASLFVPGCGPRAPTRVVEIDKLVVGEVTFVDWGGRPLLILHRDAAMLSDIARVGEALYDPLSRWSEQPAFAQNAHRSLTPAFFVAIALSPDMNCTLDFVPIREPDAQGWRGGFVDRCRGSRYDFAGRVLKQQHAKRNLMVPPYYFRSSGQLVIGADDA